ncbi:hypothetical protein K501DRAFT_272292 [Backusella circina FSU 941]|nr:hypothetical protein K501DRAFT_272292 [Backusella circina FSU 941]
MCGSCCLSSCCFQSRGIKGCKTENFYSPTLFVCTCCLSFGAFIQSSRILVIKYLNFRNRKELNKRMSVKRKCSSWGTPAHGRTESYTHRLRDRYGMKLSRRRSRLGDSSYCYHGDLYCDFYLNRLRKRELPTGSDRAYYKFHCYFFPYFLGRFLELSSDKSTKARVISYVVKKNQEADHVTTVAANNIN